MLMKILIIDDEMSALTKMKVLLSPYGECTLSTHGHQALQYCSKAIEGGVHFELITIDIQLGDTTGHELMERIKKMESDARVVPARKIMITASGTKENLVRAHTKGCDGFLVKPVKRDALEQKMLSLGYVKKVATAEDTGDSAEAGA
jgi:CheY-like chemotaxis protein